MVTVLLAGLLLAPAPQVQAQNLAAQVDSIAQAALADGPVVGLSVAVVQGERVLHAEGFGRAALKPSRPVTTETLFNAASVGKILAAAAVMRLVDEGRLDLDDTLADLLPAFPNPEQGQRITLRQLLNHTSGLHDYLEADLERLEATGAPLPSDFASDFVRGRSLDFEPGSDWRYSNTPFYFAGQIVERATGRAWGDYVVHEIARPLGLESVILCDDAGSSRAVGYEVSDDGMSPSLLDAERGVRGDAGLCATPLDLARLPGALKRSGLLSDTALQAMLAPTVLANGIAVDYGLGVALGSLDGHHLWGHVGGSPSSNVAALLHYPDADVSIAVLVNTRFGEVGALMVEAAIARVVLGLREPFLGDIPVGPDEQLQYLGRYVGDRGQWTYDVVSDGNRITRVRADDPTSARPLLHQGGHVFGRADWPMDRFAFHMRDGRARAYSAYYNGLFGGFYQRTEASSPEGQEPYDLIVAGGRVMDPETGLDAVRHLGITDGTIRAVSVDPLQGRQVLDAGGLVVAPGFIDLNTYQHGDDLFRLRAADGVTSVLALESGAVDVAEYYDSLAGRALIHYGTAVDHQVLRRIAQGDTTVEVRRGVADWPGINEVRTFPDFDQEALTDPQEDRLAELVERGLRQGAVSVGFGIEYTPGATHTEILRMFELAARYDASAHIHVRNFDATREWDDLYEVLAGAIHTGGDLHIKHVSANYGSFTDEALDFIDRARARGLSVTTEVYPYTAGSTFIDSALFDDWEEWPDARFQRVEWTATGERLTRETFQRYRTEGGVVVIHPRDEDAQEAAVRHALAHPLPMIASDGAWDSGNTHPRVSGTNSRVLGRYVREEGVLTLMDALRKMSLDPANHLSRRVPEMRRKGRVQVGADADLVIFDPATVQDQATYREPLLPPAGIEVVLVSGVAVVRAGEVQVGVSPGRPIRASSR